MASTNKCSGNTTMYPGEQGGRTCCYVSDELKGEISRGRNPNFSMTRQMQPQLIQSLHELRRGHAKNVPFTEPVIPHTINFESSDSPNAKQRSSETKESQDNNISQLLGITIAAIKVTQDFVPINLAKGILGTVANILMIVQSVIKNKSDFLAIVKKCKIIREILERVTKDITSDNLPGYLAHALLELNLSVNNINNEVVSRKEKGLLKRFFSATIDRDQIASWEKDIDHVLVLFNTEAIAGIAMRVERFALGLDGNTIGVNVLKYHPTEPPSRPSMFYGRDDLVAELTTLVVSDEHIALIGPGGMGKSSLAKAILHEPLTIEKFADRCFFVTYDGLDPSTITFETFMARFAGALGIEIAGIDTLRPISTFLHSSSALVVLDNAETFEEASASSALGKIPSVIAEIACIPGTVLILTSRSRRSAPNVPWITKDIPPLDSSSAQEAFFRIYCQADHENAEGGITNLLQDLELHPLSINLLANAAQQNGWSPVMLLERWKDRHSAVLDHGEGKLQSLSYTMQLSLNSPSIQKLGEEVRHTLAVIAFLPQDGFVKMLAPIQHYVRDSLPPPDSTCLRGIHTFYYCTVQRCSEERDGHADIITSDHLNIEHVIAFGLAHIPEVTYPACWTFLQCLKCHFPRSTSLTPAIFNIVENSSARTSKAHCLWNLGWLYMTLSQHTESMKAFKAAGALCIATGKHEMAAQCVIACACADIYRCQGRVLQSQQVLEGFQPSESWEYLSEPTKAKVWFFLDTARMYTSASADELFVKSSEDHMWGLRFKLWHWRAKFYYGEDIAQVNTHLEDLLLQCTSTGDFVRRDALEGLAEVAFCEGRLSKAMDILQTIVESEGQLPHDIPAILKALVASKQGDHALARELINPAPGLLQFFVLRTAFVFLVRSYGSACIELTAGAYDRAEYHFIATIEGCDIQGHLNFKAYSKRGLGEIAFVHGDFALALRCFMETWSLCTEMGVSTRHLYNYEPLYVLPDRFRGWTLFLEGRSPFANII
ncbi:uncharacterized protein BJ212DRAFT_1588601 [Suillus subaureus]|uniref:Novel STAND NTPase 1 domain-containing protein n=1 Tax=Suillus subaureus TaxID=48587 RepID=A0A9P7E8K3_9AGAM|nr:uncharacterized protein BJ212DRAFT_1588601 [Suillus subaureus]KAG1813584.1 hypothetical protein BJ212DRAFT_1588601 [Suillus subaureus]